MSAHRELPLATLVWQPRPNAWLVSVVCKATFRLEPNALEMAAEQEPVLTSDAYWDDDEARSLSAASDLVPSKPKADVVVVGSTFAPGGRPVRSLVARIGFETIDKSVEVVTDRSVGPDGTVYQGPRFARMPLIYERAAGGPGTWNPVGVRQGARDAYGRSPLPNITPVGHGDELYAMPPPIGLGPIAPSWPLRADKLGHHRAFAGRGFQSAPLPEDLDLGYFNIAPADQQVDVIPEDAPLLLENLHRDHATLGCKLPGVRPRVTVTRRSGAERPPMRADTLVIDTDRALLTITWRGHFSLEQQAETFRVSAEAERPRESWRTAPHAAPRPTLVDPSELTSDGTAGLPPGFTPPTNPPKKARSPSSTMAIALPGALPFQNLKKPSPRGALPFSDPEAAPSSPKPPLPPQQTGTMQIPGGLPFGSEPRSIPKPPPSTPNRTEAWSAFGPEPAPPPVFAPPVPPPSSPIAAPPPQASSAQLTATHAPLTHASAAALGGLVSASNAAADPRAKSAEVGFVPKRIEGDVLHLVWYDPDAAARIRRRPEWKKLLDKLEQGPFDPEVDEPGLADAPGELEDRREVYEIVARATPSAQGSIDDALLDAVRSDGRFAAQLLLLAGELHFDFDELEMLKAVISATIPFAGADEALKRQIDAASRFLATPGLVAAPDVATAMTEKVREAFMAGDRPVPASYLGDQTERALLERRAYQKREVFGEPQLRCQLFFAGSETGIPAYLPEAVGRRLPLFRRLRVRLLCEAHFQADQFESHTAALKTVALARIVR